MGVSALARMILPRGLRRTCSHPVEAHFHKRSLFLAADNWVEAIFRCKPFSCQTCSGYSKVHHTSYIEHRTSHQSNRIPNVLRAGREWTTHEETTERDGKGQNEKQTVRFTSRLENYCFVYFPEFRKIKKYGCASRNLNKRNIK